MFLQDMHGSLKRLMEIEEQIASQQKYSRPSDNPSEVTRGMTVGTSIARNDQYQRNLDDAVTWLSNTDTALEQVTNLVSSIREQVVYACDGGLSRVDREALARDISAMRDELIQTANFDVEGRFLLSGYDTSTKPFADDGTGHVTYRGDDGRIIFEAEKGQTGQVSLNGRDVFPLSFERQSVTSVEVPLDFRWKGTSEELRISVGDRTARVRIPERWSDTNDDSLADPTDYDSFRSPGEKVKGYSLEEIAELVNGSDDAGRLVHASVEKDPLSETQRLKFQSLTGEPLRVVSLPDTNRIVDGQKVVSDAVTDPATWTASEGTIEVDFAGGGSFSVDVKSGDTLEDVAKAVSGVEGLWAGERSDGSIAVVGSDPENTFTVTATGGGTALFPDAVSSEPVERETDTAHLGLASFLGLETATVSSHYVDGESLGDTTTDTLDMVFVSGDRKMNLVINDEADLTLEEFATRLRAVAGDWLDVVVQKEPEISGIDGHSESESSRLVITTRDGAPLSVYDKTNAYARKMGIPSGLVTKDLTGIAFPDTPASDVPALIGVEVGGKLHRVALLKEDATDGSGNLDPQKLSEQIRRQVGSDIIGVDLVDGDTSLALYSKTGEPVRVIDLPYADPSQGGRSSGLAVETGLHAGVTGESVDETLQAGAPGRFVVETGGRRLEVPVAATDTLEDIASKLRDLAGNWLDVSISVDDTVVPPQGSLALAARDGAPVNVYDLTGDAAGTFGINTDVRVSDGAWADKDVFSIDVDGYSVGIDLTDITDLQGIADHINARFGGEDVRAEVVDNAGTDELVLLSPRGKLITVNAPGGLTLPGGATTPSRSAAEEPGPYGQTVTARTGADIQEGDLFALLEDLVPAIEQGDTDGLSDSFLPRLDVAMDDVLSARATCGALRRRYETALSRLKDDNLAMTDLYSGIMDVDIAEAAVEFQTAQTVYQATLATISKVVQPTLVDYLT